MQSQLKASKEASTGGKTADRASDDAAGAQLVAPPHKRFLSGHQGHYARYVKAAKTYLAQKISAIGEEKWHNNDWRFLKPYRKENHSEFYALMYNVLNLLAAMRLPPGSVVLEVGSGAGWLTDILFGLGYEVHALEPSEDMIVAARERLAGFIHHHHCRTGSPVHHLCETLEECSLPDGSVDGILFHEALHHIVDEERGVAQCFRVLAPDGVFGVTSEAEWVPGDRNLETACEEEMARYGTMENPYTFEYLTYLLKQHGFEEITRYHSVNGFFPEQMGCLTIEQAAQAPAKGNNHITARKPSDRPTTANQRGATKGAIRVIDVKRESANGKVRIQAELTNCGETLWMSEPRSAGWMVLSLACGSQGQNFLEAAPRNRLPKHLPPGESLRMEAVYSPPANGWTGEWRLDLVNEGVAWLNLAVPVLIPA